MKSLALKIRDLADEVAEDMDPQKTNTLFFNESETLDLRTMANIVSRLENLADEIEDGLVLMTGE